MRTIRVVGYGVWNLRMAVLGVIVLCGWSIPAFTQSTDPELRRYIERVNRGEIEEARQALPDLVARFQNTAGILYLQGRLATDGVEAAKFYQGVVDNFPKSDYADDALHRIYQYYYALGLYRTAELKLQQLKRDYPDSPHVTGKPVGVLPKQEEEAVKLPPRDSAMMDTAIEPTPALEEPVSPPLPPVDSQSPPTALNGAYVLQVGAFSTVENAEKQKNFFEDRGYAVEITNKVRGGRSLYLVWVGDFRTAEAAMNFGKEIKSKYKIDSIVVERY